MLFNLLLITFCHVALATDLVVGVRNGSDTLLHVFSITLPARQLLTSLSELGL